MLKVAYSRRHRLAFTGLLALMLGVAGAANAVEFTSNSPIKSADGLLGTQTKLMSQIDALKALLAQEIINRTTKDTTLHMADAAIQSRIDQFNSTLNQIKTWLDALQTCVGNGTCAKAKLPTLSVVDSAVYSNQGTAGCLLLACDVFIATYDNSNGYKVADYPYCAITGEQNMDDRDVSIYPAGDGYWHMTTENGNATSQANIGWTYFSCLKITAVN